MNNIIILTHNHTHPSIPNNTTQHNTKQYTYTAYDTIRYDETTHTAYTMMMDSSMQYYDNIPYILTILSFAFTSAPAASNTLTTSTCPFSAAKCNDVDPSYSSHKSYSRRKKDRNNHISVKRIQYMVAQLTAAYHSIGLLETKQKI